MDLRQPSNFFASGDDKRGLGIRRTASASVARQTRPVRLASHAAQLAGIPDGGFLIAIQAARFSRIRGPDLWDASIFHGKPDGR